jgi:branched-chain amino acid transport system ATP-binding protein
VSKVAKATQKSLIGELKPTPGVKKIDPILVADGVTKRYGGLQAIDVAHVEIPRNAIVALIGPNGAEIGRASCRERV